MNILSNLVKKSIKSNNKLNILSFFYDGKFDIELLSTGHNFYGALQNSCYTWPAISERFSNLFIIKDINDINNLNIDLVIFNNRLHQQAYAICQAMHVPGLVIDHEPNDDNKYIIKKLIESCPFKSVATTEYTKKIFKTNFLVEYGVDSFDGEIEKDIEYLVVGNFGPQDTYIVNLLKNQFPNLLLVGNNPHLPYTQVVNTFNDFKNLFKRTKVFINLPQQKNLHYEILWASTYGCKIVTPNHQMYQEFIDDENSVVYKLPEEIPSKVREITMKKQPKFKNYKHTRNEFICKWNDIFESMRYEVYK